MQLLRLELHDLFEEFLLVLERNARARVHDVHHQEAGDAGVVGDLVRTRALFRGVGGRGGGGQDTRRLHVRAPPSSHVRQSATYRCQRAAAAAAVGTGRHWPGTGAASRVRDEVRLHGHGTVGRGELERVAHEVAQHLRQVHESGGVSQ